MFRGTQRRFPSKYIDNNFLAIKSTFRCLEILSGAVKFVSVGLSKGKLESSRLQGHEYDCPENSRRNLTRYESETILISFSIAIFSPKI